MYPRTIFEIIDQSHIPRIQFPADNRPLFMCAFSSDKGPEDLIEIDSNFETHYGSPDFEKHGQAILQADLILKNGGKILAKRIVANDSTLANSVVVAKMKDGTPVHATNDDGDFLYELSGSTVAVAPGDTADPSAVPVMIDTVDLKYEIYTIDNAKDVEEIETRAKALAGADSDGFIAYPIFIVTDIGRGKSNKRFRISPSYRNSRGSDFLSYGIQVIEDNEVVEELVFSLDPDRIYLNRAYSIEDVVNQHSTQISAFMLKDETRDFATAMEGKINVKNLLDEDILFGNFRSSRPLPNVNLLGESANFTDVFGLTLESGTNGNFGDNPIRSSSLNTELGKFFAGDIDDSIYDLVEYPIEAIIDANYDESVKRKIEDFVDFRDDVTFFRDQGIVHTIDQMRYKTEISARSRNCIDHHMSYMVVDPISKKQIRVTTGFSLAKILPPHLRFGRNRPIAGTLHNCILRDAIKGTVNYLPKVTPKGDQKQELNDLRVNYANWQEDQLVLQTQYTSQNEYTQLSFANNVLAMQAIVRDVRKRCPATRYSFIDGEDLEVYMGDVQAVLDKHTDNFKELTFEYIQDEVMVQNKVFHAAIRVKFRDYVQAEWFKLYAIN